MIAEYFREKDGAETLLSEGGFLTYLILENQFFITEFYLDEKFRKSRKHFYGLMNQAFKIAAEKDCKYFTCKIPLTHKKLSDVVALRLKFGFKISAADTSYIHMFLPLQECEWAAVAE